MSPEQWARRARYIDALVMYVRDNISTSDFYEDEWQLLRDSTETVDAEFYNRTVGPKNMVAHL